jgi:hypothetical protein
MQSLTAKTKLDRIEPLVPDPTCASRTRHCPLPQPPYYRVRVTFLLLRLTAFPFLSKDYRYRDMWVFDDTLHKGTHVLYNVVCK